jgi:hypothetical protein
MRAVRTMSAGETADAVALQQLTPSRRPIRQA